MTNRPWHTPAQGTVTVTKNPADLSHWLKEEDEKIYHSQYGCLSSHRLKLFMTSPALYQAQREGLLPFTIDEAVARLGRATHCLVLEGRKAFDERYMSAEEAPVNPKTGKAFGPTSQKYLDWKVQQLREVMPRGEYELSLSMGRSVHLHPIAQERIESGIPEAVGRGVYCGEECQIRIDYMSPEHGIIDLKTCGDIDYFEHDARRFKYVHQLAFYRSVAEALCGHRWPVSMIAVEKKPPYRVGVWQIGEDVLAIAQKENELAIAELQQCREAQQWPTGYEDLRVFDHI